MEIKKYIGFARMRQLVENIVSLVFDDGRYCPELFDYAFWVNISEVYANVGVEMEIDEFMQKLYLDGWKEELTKNISASQFDAIKTAVQETIANRLNANPLEPLAKALTELINELGKKVTADEIEKLSNTVKDLKEINAENLVDAILKNQK